MRTKPNSKVKHRKLPAINGSMLDNKDLIGKPYMLSFFRFTSCPFCNLRVHELVSRFDELAKTLPFLPYLILNWII